MPLFPQSSSSAGGVEFVLTRASDDDRVAVLLELHSPLMQTGHRGTAVGAVEQASDFCLAAGERVADEGPVGD